MNRPGFPRVLASLALAAVAALAAGSLALADNYVPLVHAGDVPPPYLGTNLEGDDVLTTQFAGKVLVVTFWASWCGPCRAELPRLEAIQKVAGKDKLQVVTINIEEREIYRKLARALSAKMGLSMDHDTGKKASESYGVHGIPHMVLIGRDGKVIAMHRGYDEDSLDNIIAEINRALTG